MTGAPPSYAKLVSCNDGYITPEVQDRLRHLRLMIAGCGIGSSFAELAVRMGVEHLILADGDMVGDTNLNRQSFSVKDIGTPKVRALAARLRAINPAVAITEFESTPNRNDGTSLIAEADLVFDTIDLSDLSTIVGLHDECRRQKKAAIKALAVGWGGGCIYFPPSGPCSLRRLFGLPETDPIDHLSHGIAFRTVMRRLAAHLDPTVVTVGQCAVTDMEDGGSFPISQVAPGAFTVAALAGTLVHRLMAGLPVRSAPELLIAEMPVALTSPGLNLLD